MNFKKVNNEAYKELSFEEWNKLPFECKREIWNHHWSSYDSDLGKKTKNAIVQAFADSLKIDYEQIGLNCFSQYVYMLFVIVENPKTRVPKKFADLIINKGVIMDRVEDGFARVKFKYGGQVKVNLNKKIIIK